MRFDEAQTRFQTAKVLDPSDPQHELIGDALLLKGDAQAALAEYQQVEDGADGIRGMALALYDLGRRAESEAALRELRETSGDQAPWAVAAVYAYSSEIDAAFAWLDRVLDGEFHPRWFSIVPDPVFSKLHTDPRWEETLERMGLAPAQLEELDFQVTLPQ